MSSYREDRGSRRSRSRSRDRRDAPRDNRDKGDRDRNDRDRADRDRDTRNDRDSRVDRDRNDRDRTDRDREDVRPKEKKLTRSELEALKRERVALVKRLTHGDDSDDEGKGKGKEVEVEGDGLQDVDNSEAEIAKLLGFGGFSSTKGTQVSDNKDGAASGAVSKHKERKYRQYMNRKAGFNRPLQAMP